MTLKYQRNELTLLHDLGERLAPVGSGLDFCAEEVAGRKVGEAILGHNLVALCALARSRSTYMQKKTFHPLK